MTKNRLQNSRNNKQRESTVRQRIHSSQIEAPRVSLSLCLILFSLTLHMLMILLAKWEMKYSEPSSSLINSSQMEAPRVIPLSHISLVRL